ncbi:MAG: alpha/beta hydrolase [Planctomycetota bacterium]
MKNRKIMHVGAIATSVLGVVLAATVVDGQQGQRQVNDWLAQMDADKDGKISRAESLGLMKRNFDRVDQDENGLLTQSELTALAGRLSRSRFQPRKGAQGRPAIPSDAEILQRVPKGVRVELDVAYRDGDEAWKLDLAMPSGDARSPRPAIVFVHGGGWTKGDKRTAAFIGQALDYAAKGYVTVTVNYRLDGTKLPCIEDVKCSVRWLRAHAKKYHVDPDRIGAYGNSAGAHLVTMLGISHTEERLEGDGPWKEYSSRVQAVVASATPTSPRVRGEVEFNESLIQPMSYITADAPPFLLFHEVSDNTVSVSNSDEFAKAMRAAGAKDLTYHRYTDGTGHGVFQRNIKKTAPLMEAFFARTLAQ